MSTLTLTTTVETIELPQNDGVPVKEKIIQFFMRHCPHTRASNKQKRVFAEKAYATAEYMGAIGGVEVFDNAIISMCDAMDADPNELAKLVNNQN